MSQRVKTACAPCARSHTSCELSRPCQRCVRRDIPHLCVDAQRKVKRFKFSDCETVIEDDVQQQLVSTSSTSEQYNSSFSYGESAEFKINSPPLFIAPSTSSVSSEIPSSPFSFPELVSSPPFDLSFLFSTNNNDNATNCFNNDNINNNCFDNNDNTNTNCFNNNDNTTNNIINENDNTYTNCFNNNNNTTNNIINKNDNTNNTCISSDNTTNNSINNNNNCTTNNDLPMPHINNLNEQITELSKSQHQLQQKMDKMLDILLANEEAKVKQNCIMEGQSETIAQLKKRVRKMEEEIEENSMRSNATFNIPNLISQKQVAIAITDTTGRIFDCNMWYMRNFTEYGEMNKGDFRVALADADMQQAFFCSIQNKTPSPPTKFMPVLRPGSELHWKSYFVIFADADADRKYLHLSIWKVA